jgi:hypothetical protein
MCGCIIAWTDSRSSSCTLPSSCGANGLSPLLLVGFPSPICLRSCCISANYASILSLWCAAWSKSSDKQSWTIRVIISPSSSVIIYSSGVLWAFDFLRAPPIYVVGLLFAPIFCGLDLASVSCASSTCCCCSMADCVLSFFPFWVPVFVGPSSICNAFPWPVLHLLVTWISFGWVSSCHASSFVVVSSTS